MADLAEPIPVVINMKIMLTFSKQDKRITNKKTSLYFEDLAISYKTQITKMLVLTLWISKV